MAIQDYNHVSQSELDSLEKAVNIDFFQVGFIYFTAEFETIDDTVVGRSENGEDQTMEEMYYSLTRHEVHGETINDDLATFQSFAQAGNAYLPSNPLTTTMPTTTQPTTTVPTTTTFPYPPMPWETSTTTTFTTTIPISL